MVATQAHKNADTEKLVNGVLSASQLASVGVSPGLSDPDLFSQAAAQSKQAERGGRRKDGGGIIPTGWQGTGPGGFTGLDD